MSVTGSVAMVRIKDIRSYQRLFEARQKLFRHKTGSPSLSSPLIPFRAEKNGIEFPLPPYTKRLEALISGFNNLQDRDLIRRAFALARQGHEGQLRADGSEYVTHLLSTAEIVAGWGLGAEEVAAVLCHDLIEDGRIEGGRINWRFL